MKLSILIAAYNEEQWIETVIMKVLLQEVPSVREKEIIVVDDGSTDKTRAIIEELTAKHSGAIVPIYHEKNIGKGASLRDAIGQMSGDICIIQDADLEYNPAEYSLMLEPIIEGRADCVYGSRFIGTQPKRILYFWHYVGNKCITLLSNMLTNLNFSDIETCYKAFRCDLLKSIPIRSNRFGVEPELTAKIAKRKSRVYEVGISYRGRTYEEGKKIKWVDGIKAIGVILKYWLINESEKK